MHSQENAIFGQPFRHCRGFTLWQAYLFQYIPHVSDTRMGWSVLTRWCQYDKQMSYSIPAFTCLYIWGCFTSFSIKPFIGSSCSGPTSSHISSSVSFPLAESYLLWSLLCSKISNTSSGHIKTDFLCLAYWAQQSPLCMSPKFNLLYFSPCSWFKLPPPFHVTQNQHKHSSTNQIFVLQEWTVGILWD